MIGRVNRVRIVAVDTFHPGAIGLIQLTDIVMAGLAEFSLDVIRCGAITVVAGVAESFFFPQRIAGQAGVGRGIPGGQ